MLYECTCKHALHMCRKYEHGCNLSWNKLYELQSCRKLKLRHYSVQKSILLCHNTSLNGISGIWKQQTYGVQVIITEESPWLWQKYLFTLLIPIYWFADALSVWSLWKQIYYGEISCRDEEWILQKGRTWNLTMKSTSFNR